MMPSAGKRGEAIFSVHDVPTWSLIEGYERSQKLNFLTPYFKDVRIVLSPPAESFLSWVSEEEVLF